MQAWGWDGETYLIRVFICINEMLISEQKFSFLIYRDLLKN